MGSFFQKNSLMILSPRYLIVVFFFLIGLSGSEAYVGGYCTLQEGFTNGGNSCANFTENDPGNAITCDSSGIHIKKTSLGQQTKLTPNQADQRNSFIHNNTIVWQDYRNGNWDIYMYDLSTRQETQITSNSAEQYSPSFFYPHITWSDWRNGNQDIYLYNLLTRQETQITSLPSDEHSSHLYQDKLIWVDRRNGNSDIYLRNLSTGRERVIVNETADQNEPHIFGDKIAWSDYRDINRIRLFDLSNGQEFVVGSDYHEWNPSIQGNGIVWQDIRQGGAWYDIFYQNLSTGRERRITAVRENQHAPSIYGNRIVWHDSRDGNWDIYMYDLSTGEEVPITKDPYNQFYPVIYGDKIIWEDYRNGNTDIYMYDLSQVQTANIKYDNALYPVDGPYQYNFSWCGNIRYLQSSGLAPLVFTTGNTTDSSQSRKPRYMLMNSTSQKKPHLIVPESPGSPLGGGPLFDPQNYFVDLCFEWYTNNSMRALVNNVQIWHLENMDGGQSSPERNNNASFFYIGPSDGDLEGTIDFSLSSFSVKNLSCIKSPPIISFLSEVHNITADAVFSFGANFSGESPFQGTESCEFCASRDGSCDTEWNSSGMATSFTGDFQSGNCSYQWNTSGYPNGNYKLGFRIEHPGGGKNEVFQHVIMDKTPPRFSWTHPFANSAYVINNTKRNDTNKSIMLTFKYDVSDFSIIPNCSLIFNGNINQTNRFSTEENSRYSNFVLNMSTAAEGAEEFTWSISCTDINGLSDSSETRTITLVIIGNFSGISTDLTQVDISRVGNLTFEQPTAGAIVFPDTVNLTGISNINDHVKISFNRIEINSSAVPTLNRSATLYLYNLSHNDPVVIKDGEICPPTICTIINYSNGLLTFNVTQFSVYHVEEDSSTDEIPSEESDNSGGTSSGGGGGGGGAGIFNTCNHEWICTEWDECKAEIQQRTCEFAKVSQHTQSTPCQEETQAQQTSRKCIVKISASCSDNIKNQDEIGVDCGGVCKDCETTTANEPIPVPASNPITGAVTGTVTGAFDKATVIGAVIVLSLAIGSYILAQRFKAKK